MTRRELTEGEVVDCHIGRRLRALRTKAGLGHATLGAAIGISPLDLIRCEAGLVRLRASQIYSACLALDVPVSAFFEALLPLEGELALPLTFAETHRARARIGGVAFAVNPQGHRLAWREHSAPSAAND